MRSRTDGKTTGSKPGAEWGGTEPRYGRRRCSGDRGPWWFPHFGACRAPGLPGILLATAACLALGSCDPLEELENLDFGDRIPPDLVSHSMDGQGMLTLTFSEAVVADPGDMSASDGLALAGADGSALSDPLEGSTLQFRVCGADGPLVPGSPGSITMEVRDASDNRLHMVLPFWGPNPSPALMVISEIAAKSSKTVLDALEFQVREAGNLGGLTLYHGMEGEWSNRFLFPAMEVAAGDIVVVHCKSRGEGGETDETADKTSATSVDAVPGAWDFWHPEAPGLPDSSGIASLYQSPVGPLMDAVFWCDKVTEEGKNYRSFGTSRLLRQADLLQASGAWTCGGELIAVEDGIPSGTTSATRTLQRKVWTVPCDTDSPGDWITGATGSISLGTGNPAPGD